METVIVIGAGASYDFYKIEDKKKVSVGMPTGEGLIAQMINFKRELLEYGFNLYINEIRKIYPFSATTTETDKLLADINGIGYANLSSVKQAIRKYSERNTNSYGNSEIEITLAGLCDIRDPSERFKKLAKIIAEKLGFRNHLRLSKLLNYYHPESIDNFLTSIKYQLVDIAVDCGDEDKNDYNAEELIVAGKELIAYYLLKAENASIFNADHKIWYRWLREAIINSYANKSFAELEGKSDEERAAQIKNIVEKNIEKIQIISFNYDRSLEYYLEKCIPDFADKIKAKIFYPYGNLWGKAELGEDFNSTMTKIESYEYGGLKNISNSPHFCEIFEKVKPIAKNLYVIGEDRSRDKKNLQKFARNISAESKKLYFLGFGFIEDNLKNFFGSEPWVIDESSGGPIYKQIYYTNFKNSKKIEQRLKNYFNIKVPKPIKELGTKFEPKSFCSSEKGVYDALNEDFALII